MTATHPLWRPYALLSPEEWARARVRPELQSRPVVVLPPDPTWRAAYDDVRARLEQALGDRLLALAHVGSTSVPGLCAKPTVDIDVTVADSGDEPAWLPSLEAAGFELRLREPDGEQHRLVTWPDPPANVHVWSVGAIEPQRHLAFTGWLRDHPDDLRLYDELKRRLAREHADGEMVHYNNAKAALIYDIYERIFAADPAHPHDPHPR